VFLYGNVALR